MNITKYRIYLLITLILILLVALIAFYAHTNTSKEKQKGTLVFHEQISREV